MILITCDICQKEIKNYQKEVNLFELHKDDAPKIENKKEDTKQLCKECYTIWCSSMDKFDREKEEIEKKSIEFHNKFLGFKL